MTRIPVVVLSQRSEAEALLQRLMGSGIHAELHTCRSVGTRIDVAANQFEQAHRLLLEWDQTDGALRLAVRCPECKSLRVEFPQYSRKSMLPNLFVGIMTLIGAAEKEFYCQDCHFTWPRTGTKPSRLRPHMAPYYFIEGVEQTGLTRPETRPQHA